MYEFNSRVRYSEMDMEQKLTRMEHWPFLH